MNNSWNQKQQHFDYELKYKYSVTQIVLGAWGDDEKYRAQ